MLENGPHAADSDSKAQKDAADRKAICTTDDRARPGPCSSDVEHGVVENVSQHQHMVSFGGPGARGSEVSTNSSYIDDPYEEDEPLEDDPLQSSEAKKHDCSGCQSRCCGVIACCCCCAMPFGTFVSVLQTAFTYLSLQLVGNEHSSLVSSLPWILVPISLTALVSCCLSGVCAYGGWRMCSGRHGAPCEGCPETYAEDPWCKECHCCPCCLEVTGYLCNHWFVHLVCFFMTLVVVFRSKKTDCLACMKPYLDIHDSCTWLCDMYDIDYRQQMPTVAVEWQLKRHPSRVSLLPLRKNLSVPAGVLSPLYTCEFTKIPWWARSKNKKFYIDTTLRIFTWWEGNIYTSSSWKFLHAYLAITSMPGAPGIHEVNLSSMDESSQNHSFGGLEVTTLAGKVEGNDFSGSLILGKPVPKTYYIEDVISLDHINLNNTFRCEKARSMPSEVKDQQRKFASASEGIFSCAGLQQDMLEERFDCNRSLLHETRKVCCYPSSPIKRDRSDSESECPWMCSKSCGWRPGLKPTFGGSCEKFQRTWLARHIYSLDWIGISILGDMYVPPSLYAHAATREWIPDCHSAYRDISSGRYSSGCCPEQCLQGKSGSVESGFIYLLMLTSVGDILIRVVVQYGQSRREGDAGACKAILTCAACRRFASEILHLLEFIFLPVVLARWLAELVLPDWEITKPPFQSEFYCALTPVLNATVIIHRFTRILIWLSSTTLKNAEKKRKNFRNKFWWNVYEHKKAKYLAQNVVVFQKRVLDTWLFQCFASILLAFFAILSSTTTDTTDPDTTQPTVSLAYMIMMFLVFELLLRSAAEGAIMFFGITIRRIEVAFLAGMIISLGISYEAREAGKDAKDWNCVMFVLMALMHRSVRIVGIWFHVSAIGYGAQGAMDNKALQQFQAMFADLIEVPLPNIEIKANVDLKFSLSKAKLKAGALDKLHLPVVPCGGLVEELEVTLKGQGPLSKLNFKNIGRKDRNLALTQVKVKNVLILMAPGEGLAEALGTSPFGSYWSADHVLDVKSQLVELLCKRINVDAMRARVRSMNDNESSKDQLKKAAKAMVEDKLKHVEISVKNMIIQFEDEEGVLGREHMVMSMKMGSLTIERHVKDSMRMEAARIGLRVETRTRPYNSAKTNASPTISGNWTNAKTNESRPVAGNWIKSRLSNTVTRAVSRISREQSQTSAKAWRDHYVSMLRDHPDAVCARLVRSNVAECLRMWSYDILGRCKSVPDNKRHKQTEMGPDRYVVFSLLKVSLNAGPEFQEMEKLNRYSREAANTLNEVKRAIGSDGEVAEARARAGSKASWEVISTDLGSTGISTSTDDCDWLWQISLRPIRINVDDEQIQNLRCVLSSVKKWFLHDNALRWRPKVSLTSPDLEAGFERTSVAQMWWIYAVHAVLAARGRRPYFFSIDVMWRAQTLNRYRSLLMQVVRRGFKGPRPTMQLQHLELSRCEEEELKDLQLKLLQPEIVQCRRAVLQTVVEDEQRTRTCKDAEEEDETEELWRRLWKKSFGRRRVDVSVRKVDIPVSPPEATPETSQPSEKRPAAPTPKKLLTDVIGKTVGTWELSIPEISVQLLQWRSQARRPEILKIKFVEMFLQGRLLPARVDKLSELRQSDASAQSFLQAPSTPSCGQSGQPGKSWHSSSIMSGLGDPKEKASQVANTMANMFCVREKAPVREDVAGTELANALEQFGDDAPTLPNLIRTLAPFCQLVMSMDFFHIGTGGGKRTQFKGPRHVCLCTAPLVLPRSSHPGLLDGDKMGQPVALAIRISPDCVKAAACEIISGEICAFIYDSLLLAVKKHLGMISMRDRGWHTRDISEFSEIVDGITRKDVRFTPWLHSAISTMEPVVRERLRVKKSQKLFQKWVRAVGKALNTSIVVNMRALHVMQIGTYSSKLLVEELRCLPFLGLIRGVDESALETKGASLSFNGHLLRETGIHSEIHQGATDDFGACDSSVALPPAPPELMRLPMSPRRKTLPQDDPRQSRSVTKDSPSSAFCFSLFSPICCVTTDVAARTISAEETRVSNRAEHATCDEDFSDVLPEGSSKDPFLAHSASPASTHHCFLRNGADADKYVSGGPEFELHVGLWDKDGFPCALNLHSARWRANIAVPSKVKPLDSSIVDLVLENTAVASL